MKKIISFDIFDTLIARQFITPVSMFKYIGECLPSINDFEINKSCVTPFSFYRYRIEAEQLAARRAIEEGKQYNFQDIYDCLSNITGLDREKALLIKDLELRTEIEYDYGIIENVSLLKKYIYEGYRVILISDMYLSSREIHRILNNIDSVFNEIPIYVSNEMDATKSDSNLFIKISKQEKIDFKDWTHYGDNDKSDYMIPNLLGVKSIIIKQKKYFDNTFIKLDSFDSFWKDYLHGTSLKLVQNKEYSNDGLVGLFWGAPICFGYINWILYNAKKRGITRLYFIARDGYILEKAAKILIEKYKLEIQVRYIYGSRIAWSSTNIDLLQRYIEQNIDCKDNHFAFVDVQGTGKSISKITDIIYNLYHQNSVCFLFAKSSDYSSKSCDFVEMGKLNDRLLMEHVFRAPHEVTIGYKNDNGTIIPILDGSNNLKDNTYQSINDFNNGILNFIREVSNNKLIFNKVDFISDVCLRYMHVLNESDERGIVDYFGDLNFSSNENDSDIFYAPILSDNDLKQYINNNFEKFEGYQGESIEYSLRRCNEYQLNLLKKAKNELTEKIKAYIGNISPNKKTIIVYGAGKRGKRLVTHIVNNEAFNIAAWTDMNYLSLSELPLISIDKSIGLEFDYIVITIKNKNSLKAAKMLLTSKGIDKEKIIDLEEFTDKYAK